MIYLGVDGGGTKTAFALIDKNGHTLAEHQELTCYHIEVGLEAARTTLTQGVITTIEKAGKTLGDITYAFFGLPAYGEDSTLIKTLDEMPSTLFSRDRYQCGNDMVSGWAAGFGCKDGINIVSGTGSIAYGVRGDKTARCGGWGEIFGDEGSAYWIGCKGLNTFSRMSDGRSPHGPLYEIFKSALNIKNDLDISALIHTQWNGSRGKIAQLSTLVCKAAEAGDNEAIQIFVQAGVQLADIVEGTRKSLGFSEGETTKVSYSGGAFSAEDFLLSPFKAALKQHSSSYSLQKPLYKPVVGAALYAKKMYAKKMRAKKLF